MRVCNYRFNPLVSPQLVIESVRNWMQQDMSRSTFQRVIFSSKANCSLVEHIMRTTFPLYPTAASRDSGSSYADVQNSENGVESLQNGMESLQNGTGSLQNGVGSLENGIDLLQVGEDGEATLDSQAGTENDDESSTTKHMKFEELMVKLLHSNLEETQSDLSRSSQSMPSPPCITSKSLPASHFGDSLEFVDQGPHSISPTPLRYSSRSRSQSGDLILNPDRIESEV